MHSRTYLVQKTMIKSLLAIHRVGALHSDMQNLEFYAILTSLVTQTASKLMSKLS